MSELSRLIERLKKGIARKASYVKTIRHPHLLVASLQELNELIGNDKVKDSVATQVSHLILTKRRALEYPNLKEDDVMLNAVLYGPPGVGKTLIGSKLAKVWYSLGYLDATKNSKDRRQDIGDILKEMLKEGGVGNGSNDDATLAFYGLFIFTIVFITLLSMAWSFYAKFGGMLTGIMFVLFVVIILLVGYYLYYILNTSNSSNVDNKINAKNSKNVDCPSGNCPLNNNNNNNNQGVNNANNTEVQDDEDFYIPETIPRDDEIIKIASRADFVDKYVGWSDKKTIKLLQESLGKVLFVDEAYSLVTDMHDTFGMEVLTTINLFMSQHPNEIIIIFAGYKDLLENGVFSFQPGLRRRFMWQFDCSGYNSDQLFDVFKLQLNKKGWGLTDEEKSKELFRRNVDAFPAFGGDTERLAFFSELEHSRDYISNEVDIPINMLTPAHIEKGIRTLRENNIQSGEESESVNPLANMMKMFRDGKKNNIMDSVKSSMGDRQYH